MLTDIKGFRLPAPGFFGGLFFSCFLFEGLAFGSAGQPKAFHLPPPLKRDFLNLLEKAKDFHSAFERGSAGAFRREAGETRKIIQRLKAKIVFIPHLQQRIHSHRLLSSIEEQLSQLSSQKPAGGRQSGRDSSRTARPQAISQSISREMSQRGQSRRVKKLFGAFFELAHVYGLKDEMKSQAFYCPKDKTAWFQSGGKPQNPANPALRHCGRQLL